MSVSRDIGAELKGGGGSGVGRYGYVDMLSVGDALSALLLLLLLLLDAAVAVAVAAAGAAAAAVIAAVAAIAAVAVASTAAADGPWLGKLLSVGRLGSITESSEFVCSVNSRCGGGGNSLLSLLLSGCC
jgi:hypothetical protein